MKKGTLILLSIGLVVFGMFIVLATIVGVKLRHAVDQLEAVVGSELGDDSQLNVNSSGTLVSAEKGRIRLSYDFTDFDSIDVSYAYEVTVTQGDSFSVVLSVPEKYKHRVKVSQNGRELNLSTKRSGGWFHHSINVKAEITMPELLSLEGSGAIKAEIINFDLQKFDIDISGASKILFSGCSVQIFNVELSGASKLTFGQSDRVITQMNLELSGASKVDLKKVAIKSVVLDLSGASKVELKLDEGSIVGQLSGASDLIIYGTVVNNRISSSGASKISYR